MQLVIPGNVPSQKNGKRIVKRGNRPILISSQAVLDWKEMAVAELQQQFAGYTITGYPISLTLEFYFDNKRRHDLDNAAAGVMDALSASGVIVDDSVAYVDTLILKYGGLDKQSPRAIIYIEE